MRHGKKFNHLSRTSAHRKSMLANMACSLIQHKRIKTTLAKAKALRVYVEPLITKSKSDTTHSRRIVFSYLKQKEAITELFSDISTKVANRPGGYTRILKLSNRLGDNAQMAYIELVDYNEDYITDKPTRKKVRRAKKKTIDSVSSSSKVEEAVSAENNQKLDEAVSAEVTTVKEEKLDEAVSAEETTVKEEKLDEAVSSEETTAKEEKVDEAVSAEETTVKEEKLDEAVSVVETPVKKEEDLSSQQSSFEDKNMEEDNNPNNKDKKGE